MNNDTARELEIKRLCALSMEAFFPIKYIPASGWFEKINRVEVKERRYSTPNIDFESARFGLLNSVEPNLLKEYDFAHEYYLEELEDKKKDEKYLQLLSSHPCISKLTSAADSYYVCDDAFVRGGYYDFGKGKWKHALKSMIADISELIGYKKLDIEKIYPIIEIMMKYYPEEE